jgi:photosystem II stability/assembly factor-like uncharacterized protein
MRRILLLALLLALPTTAAAVWSWQNPSPQGNTLKDVHFIDAETGFAVGEWGTVVRTVDGGTTWQLVTPVFAGNYESVCFTDALTGFVAGVAHGSLDGLLRRTTDGGVTWQDMVPAGSAWLNSVCVGPDGFGAAVGRYGGIWRTADGGLTWTEVDGGAAGSLQDVAVIGAGTAVAVSTQGEIVRTVDAGLSWDAMESGTTQRLEAVAFADSLHGLAVGYAGTIRITLDGGVTWWARTGLPVNYYGVALAGDEALAVGVLGAMIISDDGGLTWGPATAPDAESYYGAHAGAAGLVVVGGYGVIHQSDDHGATWTPRRTGPGEVLRDVALADGRRGAAVGSNGALLVTDDGGDTWQASPQGQGGDFMAVALAGRDTIVAVSFWGQILRSADGGDNWLEVFQDGSLDLEDVCFAGHHGFAVGGVDGQGFLVSGDGGLTWLRRAQGTPDLPSAYGVAFRDTQHGLIAHTGGVMVTTDGGTTWLDQPCPTDRLWSVTLGDDGTALAVGNGGAIVRTVQSTWPAAVRAGTVPGPVVVHPAVPNPFNPRTRLSWEMPADGPVWLTVHDVRGRLVRELIAGAVWPRGRQAREWDGRDDAGRALAAGVYLVRVRTAAGTATGRALLLK